MDGVGHGLAGLLHSIVHKVELEKLPNILSICTSHSFVITRRYFASKFVLSYCVKAYLGGCFKSTYILKWERDCLPAAFLTAVFNWSRILAHEKVLKPNNRDTEIFRSIQYIVRMIADLFYLAWTQLLFRRIIGLIYDGIELSQQGYIKVICWVTNVSNMWPQNSSNEWIGFLQQRGCQHDQRQLFRLCLIFFCMP